MNVDVFPAPLGGQRVPTDATSVLALDFSRHGVDDVVVLGADGSVYLLTAPGIHQEYRRIAAGVSAMTVVPGAGADGGDGLAVSDSAGIHLLTPDGTQLLSDDIGCRSAAQLLAGDWDGDQDVDLIVRDESVPGFANSDRISFVECDSTWTVASYQDFAGEVCDMAFVRGWAPPSAGSGPMLWAVVNSALRAFDPNDSFAEPWAAVPVQTTSECIELETIHEGASDKLAMAWSMPIGTEEDEQSWLLTGAPTNAEPAPGAVGFVAANAVMLRDQTVRGMWSGSSAQDGVTDLLIAFSASGQPDPLPDLYLNDCRFGGPVSFVLTPGFSWCLSLVPEQPQVTSGFAMADIDGDGAAEFVYGTDAATSGFTEFAAARMVQGPLASEPAFTTGVDDHSYDTLGTDQINTVTVSIAGATSPAWPADHLELILWRIYGRVGSAGDLFTDRPPALRSVAPISGMGDVEIDFTLPVGDLGEYAYFGVVRVVQDAAPTTAGVERAGPGLRFVMRPDGWSTLPAGNAYVDAVLSLGQGGAAPILVSHIGDGGIPLIIDPVVIPPIPPLPPAPTPEPPVTGTQGTTGSSTGVGQTGGQSGED